MPPGDLKHRAKRRNERVKLLATFFNSIGIVTLAAAFINPIATRHYDVLESGGWILLLVAVSAHIMGQMAFVGFMAEE